MLHITSASHRSHPCLAWVRITLAAKSKCQCTDWPHDLCWNYQGTESAALKVQTPKFTRFPETKTHIDLVGWHFWAHVRESKVLFTWLVWSLWPQFLSTHLIWCGMLPNNKDHCLRTTSLEALASPSQPFRRQQMKGKAICRPKRTLVQCHDSTQKLARKTPESSLNTLTLVLALADGRGTWS